MSGRNLALAAPPNGAGRFQHFTYPARGQFTANTNTGAGNNVSNRSGAADFAAASVGTGGASGSASTQVYSPNAKDNIQCIRLHNAAAGDSAFVNFGAVGTLLEQGTNPAFSGDPDRRVWSFRAVLAFTALTGAMSAAADLGLMINPGNVNSMNNGGSRPGIMFGPVDNANIALRCRWQFVGGYTVNQVTTFAAAGIADITGWNLYELRIIGATGAAAAVLKAYVNGKQVGAAVSFGVNGGGPGVKLLPSVDGSGGGFLGLQSRITNNNVGGNNGIANPYDCYIFNAAEVHAASEQQL